MILNERNLLGIRETLSIPFDNLNWFLSYSDLGVTTQAWTL